MAKLSIIVPAHNEAGTILEVIARLRALDVAFEKEIIVVDDGSTDATPQLLRSLAGLGDVKILTEDRCRGKGHAVRQGIARSTGDWICLQDADLELSPSDILGLLAPLSAGRADAVFGSRFLRKGRGDTPAVHYLGNRALTSFGNRLFGLRLTDLLTGYKLLPGEEARAWPLRSEGFEIDAEIAIHAARRGLRIEEVPVSYAPRGVAEGKKLRLGHGWAIGLTLLRLAFERRLRRLAR